MYASVQSKSFPVFYCRVFSEPVKKNDTYMVYKLVGFDEEIKKIVKGIHVGTFDHIAIDNFGNVHLFDTSKQACVGNGGLCEFIVDGPGGPGTK